MKRPNFFKHVYALVQKIPPGKVLRYGDIARLLGTRDARKVGWALHGNPDEVATPCHRVVNKDGRLAPNFAFSGPREQFARLKHEGVSFIDDMHVDLKKHLWRPKGPKHLTP